MRFDLLKIWKEGFERGERCGALDRTEPSYVAGFWAGVNAHYLMQAMLEKLRKDGGETFLSIRTAILAETKQAVDSANPVNSTN